MSAKKFNTPFAILGDKVEVPTTAQIDGSVSFEQGYPFGYEADYTNPNSKDISRSKTNQLLFDITNAIREIQQGGVSEWSEDGKPYKINSLVYAPDGTIKQSLIANNNNDTTHSSWANIINVSTLATILANEQVVRLSGDQTIAGIKTFSTGITMSSGTNDTSDLVFKDPINNTFFLMDMANENFRFYRSFQGGGNIPILNISGASGVFNFTKNPITSEVQSTLMNALTRKDYVDGLDSSNVKLTGNQTIAGVKTFSSTIAGSINGNSATVTNGVYTDRNQTISGVKTFSSSPIVPTPTAGTQAVNKDYADLKVAFTDFTGGINQSLSSNGYQGLPGGLILQWGRFTSTTIGHQDVNYNFAFPGGVLYVGAGGTFQYFDMDNPALWTATIMTNSYFKANRSDALTADRNFCWFAIGY